MSTQPQAPLQPEAQPPPPQPSTNAPDAHSYYGYLFETDKKPTKVLEALLHGVATYISESVGNTDEKALTPDKLASFYKAVGGNYDSLFVDVPHPSVSWIYASIGCQHTLIQQNDFSPPTIPALTPKGFVRWQSIEILLGPEEHVPFIQNAIRLFPIFNPLTGLPFPLPLPQEAFPLVPDPDIAKWHDQCAQELRHRASPDEEVRPHLPPRPKVQAGYTHVRPPRPRVDPDYFEPKSMRGTGRPFAYNHVSSTGVRGSASIPVRPPLTRAPSHRARHFLGPEDPAVRGGRGRRASFPENTMPSPQEMPNPPQMDREDHTRRHSHPRHARMGSMSEDASSSEEGSPSTPIAERRRRRRSYAHERPGPSPPVAVRYSMTGEAPEPRLARERERDRGRDKDEDEGRKRKSFPSIPIDITGKLSAPFLLGKRDRDRDRQRAKPRSSSRSGGSGGNVRWRDLDGQAARELWRGTSGGNLEEEGGRSRDDRERERKRREKERSQRNSYEDDSRGSGQDGRYRHRDRERDREAVVNGRVPLTVPEGRNFRDRDRERDRGDKRPVSPLRGVDGRRYPAHA
ncbi:uncharacterized protein RSE6_13153 [Rhynchosporium secalis]|uniref:DUF7514 domain-containing protein n=1 Tax=Rhynchosporium secalis TaxID=38038 RepID=A0A1E1MS82_RHYSE|nr:uncharacterized protein RSE6_13153 [Rhynchosporium secalis]